MTVTVMENNIKYLNVNSSLWGVGSARDHLGECSYLEVSVQTGNRRGSAIRSPGRVRVGPSAAVCLAGIVLYYRASTGTSVWELSRVSPAWLRWMLADSPAAVFFLVIAWQNTVI